MDIVARVNKLLEQGESFCMVTVLQVDAQKPAVGHKVLVRADGHIEGSFGSRDLELNLCRAALAALKEKKSRLVEIEDGLRVFLDVITTEARLIVCGAGHIAVPLVRFAEDVGFKVTVIDDRSDFAHPSRFPESNVIAENFTLALRDMPLGPTTYVVIITRGHEHDVDCLTEVLNKDTAYIGLIGSRRRVQFVLEWLDQKGFSSQRLKDVFTPIGLPIGADSPEEIAISIVSELVCVRRKGASQARTLRTSVGTKL